MFRALRVSALVCLGLLTSLSTLSAQSRFATITGTVRDPSGAAIANATITATQSETGVVWKATSNKEGIYTLPQLREGPYVVVVEADGFKRVIASDVALVARDIRRLDI